MGKTQDLQKLIAQADSSSKNLSGLDKKALKKKMMGANGSTLQSKSPIKEQMDTGGIKFPDFKASGVYLRSQRMKLPPSVGQKKTKAIEQLLEVPGVDANPVPSEIMYVLITCFHESRIFY